MVAPLLLIAALTLPASAAKLPDCIHVSSTSVRYKADLDAVRDCQEKARRKMIDDAVAKGKPLSYGMLEKIDDQQRAQVRDFLANSGTIIEGATKSDRGLGGVTQKDLRRAAGDGKEGITPAMGRDLIDSLTKKQGFISPEMKDLLDSVVRDGGKLTPETMKRLQSAVREAKGAGLDLNIDAGKEPKPEAPAGPGNL